MSPERRALPQIGGDDRAFLRRKRRPDYGSGEPSVRLVDLFSGCGGLTLGVAEACRASGRKLDIRLAVEFVPEIWSVYQANFPGTSPGRSSDVLDWLDGAVGAPPTTKELNTKALVGAVTIISGGPPCQGHSNLNNHTRGRDPKNALYDRLVRAAEVLGPEHVLVENVPSLARDHSGVLHRAVAELTRLKYSVTHKVVRVSHLGAAQLRARHVLVATRGPVPPTLADPPRLRLSRTLRWAIGDLETSEGMYDSAGTLSDENTKRALYLISRGEYDLPNHLRPICHQDPTHKYKSMYGRLDWDKPAQTITTGFGSPGQGRYLHPDKCRTITPHEAARLQFFPDWYDFSSVTKRGRLQEMIGNAVPPKLSYLLTMDLLGAAATRVAATDHVQRGRVAR